MAEDVRLRFQRLRWLVTKLETYHSQVDEMMLLSVKDGLGAMQYGQYGGSFPDPTAQAAFTTKRIVDPDGTSREVVVWRDHRPEDDRKTYWDSIAAAEKALEKADEIRRTWMSANNEIRNRLDPNEFCRLHWFLRFEEGAEKTRKLVPHRYRGDLCKECYEYSQVIGRAPNNTEVDYHFRHQGKWPPILWDPKERRIV